VGGTPEILGESYLFEPNDTAALVELVKTVIGDPEKLAQMSAASLATARRYHVDEVSNARRAFFSAVRSVYR
jgi:glycosyltransferase involved in cell wall biosynthesis